MSIEYEKDWRRIVLYGRNTASYKFALARALLKISADTQGEVSMEELALPFSKEITRHIGICDTQSTNANSQFLNACRAYNQGEVDDEHLLDRALHLGFKNVIGAFHYVDSGNVQTQFFDDQRKIKGKLVLTDEFYVLASSIQKSNLLEEVEARWRLVEAAWALKLPSRLLNVDYNNEKQELFIQTRLRRVNLTSARSALDGYQMGRCFYCRTPIQVLGEGSAHSEVDHFFPWVLMKRGFDINLDLLWNLVLACKDCNRGSSGKFERIPARKYLKRLHHRNEALIKSHKPLRETLMNLSGPHSADREIFINEVYKTALDYMNPNPWTVDEVEVL